MQRPNPRGLRKDLRCFFQWAADQYLEIPAAARAHIEICRSTMEQRGLAASTINRRLSTVCGYYRFAHIGGRISSNPAPVSIRRPWRSLARCSRRGPRSHIVQRRAHDLVAVVGLSCRSAGGSPPGGRPGRRPLKGRLDEKPRSLGCHTRCPRWLMQLPKSEGNCLAPCSRLCTEYRGGNAADRKRYR